VNNAGTNTHVVACLADGVYNRGNFSFGVDQVDNVTTVELKSQTPLGAELRNYTILFGCNSGVSCNTADGLNSILELVLADMKLNSIVTVQKKSWQAYARVERCTGFSLFMTNYYTEVIDSEINTVQAPNARTRWEHDHFPSGDSVQNEKWSEAVQEVQYIEPVLLLTRSRITGVVSGPRNGYLNVSSCNMTKANLRFGAASHVKFESTVVEESIYESTGIPLDIFGRLYLVQQHSPLPTLHGWWSRPH
jgi:hypothetical protein